MSGRGVGVTSAVTAAVPEVLVPVLSVLTFLGGTFFLVSVGPAIYWFGPTREWLTRRDGARLLAVTLGGLALVVATKSLFAMPRPPEHVMLVAEEGNGFPSGHATGAAVFYGALAALTTVWSRARRWLLAAGFVLLVGFTRIALGVHYLVDVLAGFALGAAFLAVALALTRRRIHYGFALAAVIAGVGFVIAGPTDDAVGALAATVGALTGWVVIGRREALESHVHPVAGAAALGALGGTAAVTLQLNVAVLVVAATHAVAGAAFVALPAIQDHWRDDELTV
ncbi:PAP2 family phosphoesterase [Halobacterium sp. DL1]|jgi:membrane-associated phospholipid phosphatase|nr:PAP2 family phosphoesterase [Halobacterium sp. DL1]